MRRNRASLVDGVPGVTLAAVARPRLCARPGCSEPAAATLVFQYASRTVRIEDLQEPEPATIDLCGRHADRTSAPRGWAGEDRRAKPLALAPLIPLEPISGPLTAQAS